MNKRGKVATNLEIDPTVLAAMHRLKEVEGIPLTKQLDFALHAWLEARGALKRGRRRTESKSRSRQSQ